VVPHSAPLIEELRGALASAERRIEELTERARIGLGAQRHVERWVAPVLEPSVTLRPRGGLPVRLERRTGV